MAYKYKPTTSNEEQTMIFQTKSVSSQHRKTT